MVDATTKQDTPKSKAYSFEAEAKAKDRTVEAKAKAKARTVEAKAKAKDTNFVLEDPRGQGLGSRTTSLYKTKW